MLAASPQFTVISALFGIAGVLIVLSPFVLRLISSLRSGEFDDD